MSESPLVEKIPFVSRHQLSEAQQATLASQGFVGYNLEGPDFDIEGPARPQLEAIGVNTSNPFCLVAPAWFLCQLVHEEGCPTVFEFVNHPPARRGGKFLCRGVMVHRPTSPRVTFVPCPVPLNQQEPDELQNSGGK
jgi:hypothetical protein